ncbi:MAG: hypothetical protein DI539_17910 [Flavobacterium psychrophilum]|nr:MAG: hypothetical protein DI539_17910 [Flavobacterium psychrophilum]
MGILSVMLLIACTEGDQQLLPETPNTSVSLKSSQVIIENKSNPYDAIGQDYRNFLSSYKTGTYSPSNYAAVVNSVNALTGFTALSSGNVQLRLLLNGCMNTPEITLSTLLQNSNLSPAAKDLLTDFINSYQKLANEPFSSAYDDIVLTETEVSNSNLLIADERRILLTVTSVVRYSLYHSCCEDTDWEKSVGNIVAFAAGALENNELALQYALITSIAGLENIQLPN